MSKRPKSISSFGGKIEEIQGIYVDNFETIEKHVRAFFLSHCHTDHMVGLFSEELYKILKESQDIFIYTSELTSAIIKYDYGEKGTRLMEYIRVLPKGSKLIALPARKDIKEEYITITTVPAGHCAGATMFLFRTPSMTILYTGDFRIHINDLSKYQAFCNNNNDVIPIHTMYIDTTFLNELYENFPKRSESVDNMIFEMKKWLKSEDNAISIYTPARYGYEFVFNKIFEVFNTKVYVNDDRWKMYRNIPNLVPGVTNDPASRIHLCRIRQQTSNHATCGVNKFQNYLHIYLSAMKWDMHNVNCNSVYYRNPRQLDVCFATHCSRNEILYFVNYLSPKRIVGFPNEFTRSCDNKLEVKRKKVDNDVLKMMLRT